MGRGVNAPDRRSDAQDDLDGVPHLSVDCAFLGEGESEEHVSSVLFISERRMTWAMLVPRKSFPGSQREQRDPLTNLDTTESRSV